MFPYADLEGNKNQEKGFREICGSLLLYAYLSPLVFLYCICQLSVGVVGSFVSLADEAQSVLVAFQGIGGGRP